MVRACAAKQLEVKPVGSLLIVCLLLQGVKPLVDKTMAVGSFLLECCSVWLRGVFFGNSYLSLLDHYKEWFRITPPFIKKSKRACTCEESDTINTPSLKLA